MAALGTQYSEAANILTKRQVKHMGCLVAIFQLAIFMAAFLASIYCGFMSIVSLFTLNESDFFMFMGYGIAANYIIGYVLDRFDDDLSGAGSGIAETIGIVGTITYEAINWIVRKIFGIKKKEDKKTP